MHRLPQRLFVHNNRHQVSAAVALCRTAQHHPWDLVGPCPSYQCGSRHSYSTEPGKRPSFFGNLLDNIRQEYSKNKEMQDSLAKFREEAKKLEDSEALREARRKFHISRASRRRRRAATSSRISSPASRARSRRASRICRSTRRSRRPLS